MLVKPGYARGVDRKSAAAKASFWPWDCYSSHSWRQHMGQDISDSRPVTHARWNFESCPKPLLDRAPKHIRGLGVRTNPLARRTQLSTPFEMGTEALHLNGRTLSSRNAVF